MYIYIYIYVYTYVYICMCIYLSISSCLRVSLSLFSSPLAVCRRRRCRGPRRGPAAAAAIGRTKEEREPKRSSHGNESTTDLMFRILHICLCTYAVIYLCIELPIYLATCIFICMYTYMYICMCFVHTYAYTFIEMRICRQIYTHFSVLFLSTLFYIQIRTYVYVCIYTYRYICVRIPICP